MTDLLDPRDLRSWCPVHKVWITLGTGCDGCVDDHLAREADMLEAMAAHRGEL